MILKQFLSSVFLLLTCFIVIAQKIETKISWHTNIPDAADNIIYHPHSKLSIADFKGTPDPATDAVAITASGFMFNAGYHLENKKATLTVAVYCSFNKNESWMKEKGKTAYILAHEQRHFDISYLSTLEFIKKVKNTNFSQQDYMEQLKAIYIGVVQQMKDLQDKYDEETNNGINVAKQEEWNIKIVQKLGEAENVAIL